MVALSTQPDRTIEFALLWRCMNDAPFPSVLEGHNPEEEFGTPLSFAASAQFVRLQTNDIV